MQQFNIGKIITSLKSSYGKDFLDTITMQLHQAISAQYTFIAKLDKERSVSQTLSLVAGNDFGENFEYSLEFTPCADVSDDSTCIFPNKICDIYPKDQLLIDMGIEGYIGSPLHRANGEVFGIVVALYENNIENADDVAALFELFAGRISAELERSENEKALKALNESLEQNVAFRTAELEIAIKQLKESQNQLIEQEKLASLGRLVAGVAHEVNTPLGVAVLGNSTLVAGVQKLASKFDEKTLSKNDLATFISDATEAAKGVEFNLSRASELVGNFKQMATEFHTDEKNDVKLIDWITSISTSLNPMLKRAGIRLDLKLPDSNIVVSTYPSRLAQVITNVISNATKHAYPDDFVCDDKTITIELTGDASNYSICITDNGKGMNENIKAHVLEPFFTTNRDGGGMGLGMSIVHNLMTNSLNGILIIDSSEGFGTKINLHFECGKHSLLNSFQRATHDGHAFYTNFHEKLIDSDESIRQLFKSVDVQKQRTMVFQSVNMFIVEMNNLESLFEGDSFRAVVNKHKGMNIGLREIKIWQQCFVDTVAEFDDKFTAKLRNLWEDSLSEFSEHFAEKLSSD